MESTKEDVRHIKECINLSKKALKKGDKPFGAIITLNGNVVAKATNNSKRKVYEHAELVALDKAAKKLGKIDLTGATLYSNCEPCASCSFFIREYHISKIVYSISSPGMGGMSHYPILKDEGLNNFKPYFGEVPMIISGVLEEEALKVFEGTPLKNYFGQVKNKH
jgi:tRNA(adenine34) deaminase